MNTGEKMSRAESRSRKNSTTTFCYYRAGKDRKGIMESVARVTKMDPYRKEFIKRLRTDERFRKEDLGWTKKPIEQYVKEYKEVAKCPGEHIPDSEVLMCTNLYLRGEIESKDDKSAVIRTKNGKSGTFSLAKREWCLYHESHDVAAVDMPDDVCKIKAFGEAALLLTMKKRFTEALNIYTYVSDIVLCLNPYMMLPKMVKIQEYPQQKMYKKGTDPSSYASAHFAYWGTRDADSRLRNNSCIVSGESGSGKTVACSFIVKYLAKLSAWRKKELGEDTDVGSDDDDDNTKHDGERDISKLVGGISPFLEMFGNAKTRMNDNSSRFGKFTKIWFMDGKIIGAELVHYLLEKARLANQGAGERTYHVFYGLIRGATAEERSRMKLKSCEDYACIMKGGSSIVGHGHGPEYDSARFNNPLDDDPDNTGIRAALKAAHMGADRQAQLWDVVAGILKLLNLDFVEGGASSDGGGKTSRPKSSEAVKEVVRLLGLNGPKSEELGYLLTVFRIKPPKSKVIDSPVGVDGSIDNRNALGKEIYGRVFAYLIDEVCNKALKPSGKGDAFVGLLDIFGFEVMAKNSIEQLCINFANEKLQQLFNHHIFDEEKITYDHEGLSTDVIPEHADNTPCCNLVEATGRHFVGILGSLDDATRTGAKMTDQKFLLRLVGKFGRKRKKHGEVFEGAKGVKAKQASAHFYAHKKKDYLFYIVHYAKEVEYDIRGFLRKNRDKLPVQLFDVMQTTTQPLLHDIFVKKVKKSKKGKDKTLASKYLTSLKLLAKTLKETTPNYVRCVKPNGVHFRPIDGAAAFDEWRTYRQLLYAGVMEVVKIKNDGYPFRMEFDRFWNMCVDEGYDRFLNVDAACDPREGCEAVATAALRPPEVKKIPGTKKTRPVHFWTCGKTLLFGKADTEERLVRWHQLKVAGLVQTWWRYFVLQETLGEVSHAAFRIGETYRRILTRRRFAAAESHVIRIQAMIRGLGGYRRYLRRRRVLTSARIAIRTLRQYASYLRYHQMMKVIIRARARSHLRVWSEAVASSVRESVATAIVQRNMVGALRSLRTLKVVQKIIRRVNAIGKLRKGQRRLQIMTLSAQKAAGLWRMGHCRQLFGLSQNFIISLKPFIRMEQSRRRFLVAKKATSIIQRFARRMLDRKLILKKISSVQLVQRFLRTAKICQVVGERFKAARKIENFFWSCLMKIKFRKWFKEMNAACLRGDAEVIRRLVKMDRPYERLQQVPTKLLINMRDAMHCTSFVHSAAQAGSLECIRVLVEYGCSVDTIDSMGNTPLHESCTHGDAGLEITKYLFSVSSNKRKILSMRNKEGHFPCDLTLLSSEDKTDLVTWLLENGASASEEAYESLQSEIEAKEIAKSHAKRQEERLQRAAKDLHNSTDFAWKFMLLSMPERGGIFAGVKPVEDRATRKHRLRNDISVIVRVQAVVRGFLLRLKMRRNDRLLRVPRKVNCVNPDAWKSWRSDMGEKYYYHKRMGYRTWNRPGVGRRKSDVVFDRKQKVGVLKTSLKRAIEDNEILEKRIRDMRMKLLDRMVPSWPTRRGVQRTETADQSSTPERVTTFSKQSTAQEESMTASAKVPTKLLSEKKKAGVKSLFPFGSRAAMKIALTRALMVMEAPKCRRWYYIDGARARHGPFADKTMSNWSKHFHPDQHIARAPEGPYASIVDVFGAAPTFSIDEQEALADARVALVGLLKASRWPT